MENTYALFDFDGTLIKGDSIVRFAQYARKCGLCGTDGLIRGLGEAVGYCLHLRTAVQAKEAVTRFVANHSEDEISLLAEHFCRDVLFPALYSEGVEAIRRCREEGAEALLITASPAFYLQPLKNWMGFQEIIGTRMELDARGMYTGHILGENCKGVQKTLRLAEYLDARGEQLCYDSSIAYGDSGSDRQMMALCRRKVAVNPKRGLMRWLSGEQHVTVVHWR